MTAEYSDQMSLYIKTRNNGEFAEQPWGRKEARRLGSEPAQAGLDRMN